MSQQTKVVTDINTRLSYANIWEPKSINGGKEKYSVSLIIPKSDQKTISAIEKAIDAAYQDSYFINANSITAPQIVDKHVQPILDRDEVYSGCYARVSINFYAFNTNGNRGIACGLGNIQKIRDGEPLGGHASASDDFTAIDDSNDDDFLA